MLLSFTFPDFDYNYFWRWTNFSDYCIFVSLFSLTGGLLTALFINVSIYIELLGFASLLLEACLGLPQLWRNFSNQSTEGMRSGHAVRESFIKFSSRGWWAIAKYCIAFKVTKFLYRIHPL